MQYQTKNNEKREKKFRFFPINDSEENFDKN